MIHRHQWRFDRQIIHLDFASTAYVFLCECEPGMVRQQMIQVSDFEMARSKTLLMDLLKERLEKEIEMADILPKDLLESSEKGDRTDHWLEVSKETVPQQTGPGQWVQGTGMAQAIGSFNQQAQGMQQAFHSSWLGGQLGNIGMFGR